VLNLPPLQCWRTTRIGLSFLISVAALAAWRRHSPRLFAAIGGAICAGFHAHGRTLARLGSAILDRQWLQHCLREGSGDVVAPINDRS